MLDLTSRSTCIRWAMVSEPLELAGLIIVSGSLHVYSADDARRTGNGRLMIARTTARPAVIHDLSLHARSVLFWRA
jgi:hypothetical protein